MNLTRASFLAAEGEDFTDLGTGSFTIPAGQDSVVISVGLINDTMDEPSEDINIDLFNVTNAKSGHYYSFYRLF